MGKEQSTSHTLGLVITDGVGYRNFVLSSFLEKALNTFTHIYLFSGLPESAYNTISDNRITIIELPVFVENRRNWFYRKLKEVAHLQKHHNGNLGIADNLQMNYKKGWSPRAILVKAAYAISKLWHSEKAILTYEKWQERSFADDSVVKTYDLLLTANRPDILFFTHQRPPFIATLSMLAKKYSIPKAAFIFSWDNLASKGRMASTFDYYLVWSDLMKNELLRFYPDTKEKQISVVGTPQFEPYVMDGFDVIKAAFFNHFALDSTKKIICYSCADVTIGPNDPEVIGSIVEAIRKGDLRNTQLLVRTSPAEDETRFLSLKEKYPEICWNHPSWRQTREGHPEPWSQRIPDQNDISELKAVLQYCDISVNMCSTMSLDAMIFKKPVVNAVFGNPENGRYNDQRFLNYEHYDNVIKSGAVTIVKDAKELTKALQNYLDNPNLHADERAGLIELQIGKPLNKTTEAVVNAIYSIL